MSTDIDKARESAPLLCLNGSPVVQLIEARLEARNALLQAMKALEETAPHARDYQLDRTGQRYSVARARYVERFAALSAIWGALGDECEAIQEQEAMSANAPEQEASQGGTNERA